MLSYGSAQICEIWWTKKSPLLANSCCFLALTAAEIIQPGAAHPALLLHFYLRDPRRVQREHALNSFAVRNASNGERCVESASFAANHDSSEYLDAFFVAFHHARVHAHAVADGKRPQVGFLLFFLDDVDAAIHSFCKPRKCGRTLSFEDIEFANGIRAQSEESEPEHEHEITQKFL